MSLDDLLDRLFQRERAALDFGENRLLRWATARLERVRVEQIEPALQSLTARQHEAVLGDLSAFFDRYWQTGTFVPHSRRPPPIQDGVHLSWRSAGQLYVKTTARHIDYSARLPPTPHLAAPQLKLRLSRAATGRDVAKSTGLRYALRADEPLTIDGETLTVWFVYGQVRPSGRQPTQRRVDHDTVTSVLEHVPPRWREALGHRRGRRTLLEIHLSRYTAPDDNDLFIHEDLGSFLRDDLRFFLAELVVESADATTLGPQLAACREVASALIELLASLEDLRLTLYRTRRLVLSSRWLVPTATGMLDTKGFTPRQAWDTLAEHAPELPGERAGTLIHGNNRDALALLGPSLKGRVSAAYLDPPYNTGTAGFLYNDGFARHTWLSLVQQVVEPLANLADSRAFLWMSIDENEVSSLMQLGEQILGPAAKAGLFSVRVRHEDRTLAEDKEVHEVIEYAALFRMGRDAWATGRQVPNDDDDAYSWRVVTTGEPDREESIEGRRMVVYGPGRFVLEREEGGRGLKRINIRGTLRRANSSGRFYVAHVEPHLTRYQGCLLQVEGMGADGLGHRWFWVPPASHRRKNPDYFQGIPLRRKRVRRVPYPTFIDLESAFNRVAHEGGVTFRDGKKPIDFLHHLMTIAGVRDRKDGLIVDLFAGSGSTAEAVIRLNQEDGGRRRYLLTEVGDHALDITTPRLAHAARSALDETTSPPPLVQQIVRLTSYDDTLESVLGPDEEPEGDRRLRIQIGADGDVSIPALRTIEDPWRHTVSVVEGGVRTEHPVDLVETFVHLLGLEVHCYDTLGRDRLVCVTGVDPEDVMTTVVWRDCRSWPDEELAEVIDPHLLRHQPRRLLVNGGTPTLRWAAEPLEPVLLQRMLRPSPDEP